MQVSLRVKMLLLAAATIATYVIAGSSDEQPVEAARSGQTGTTSAKRATTKHAHRYEASRMLESLTHRVTADTPSDSLFAAHSWYIPPPPPPPPPPAPVLTPEQEAAMRVPVAPPLPYSFMGSYVQDGSAPVIFLTRGDRVYNVRVGDTLEDYSIDSLANGQLVMTYKPLHIQQQLTVGSAQ